MQSRVPQNTTFHRSPRDQEDVEQSFACHAAIEPTDYTEHTEGQEERVVPPLRGGVQRIVWFLVLSGSVSL